MATRGRGLLREIKLAEYALVTEDVFFIVAFFFVAGRIRSGQVRVVNLVVPLTKTACDTAWDTPCVCRLIFYHFYFNFPSQHFCCRVI